MDFESKLYSCFHDYPSHAEENFLQFLKKLKGEELEKVQYLASSFPFSELHPLILNFLSEKGLVRNYVVFTTRKNFNIYTTISSESCSRRKSISK